MRYFRTIAYLEGISFLVLLGIAMPLKYVYGRPEAVKVVGWLHGLLFVLYLAALAMVASEFAWSRKKAFYGLIASVLPFGPIVFDRMLHRLE